MTTPPTSSIPLSFNWTFKQGPRHSSVQYLTANNLPTEIHLDLLKNGVIADPFLNMNELSVRWVGEETWTYKTEFTRESINDQAGARTDLVFEGLDTFCIVYLNGEKILESENMFVSHRVDVTGLLRYGTEELNILELEFESARKTGLELMKEHPEHEFIVHQTEVSRGPVRKAQFHWGWDWGPILLGCGPWKPVVLEQYVCLIEEMWVDYTFGEKLDTVHVELFVRVQGALPDRVRFEFHCRDGTAKSGRMDLLKKDSDVFHTSLELEEVELWWPRGYGNQSLYTFLAEIWSEDKTLIHSSTKEIGFRKAELIQEPDEHGTSFFFRINDVDIFCGGSCWIPADSFLPRVSADDYKKLIQLAVDGNQTMIRIWGGGIYESNAFYNTCDKLGLLVWQDFAFACASYPTYPTYLTSVELEARQNVRRLRHHPSLIIWCGNNEDYQIVERYSLEYNVDDNNPESWLKTNFPARYIYEYLLPKIIIEETKGTIYHPSSPFGNGRTTVLKVDPTIGDIHQWNIWHGNMFPYQHLPRLGGRFVSEFGMEAYPAVSTIEKCITDPADRYPGSMILDFRNKAIGHSRRLMAYVDENFKMESSLKGFGFLTQIMQADALGWAYRNWRRDWGTSGRRKCGGVLVWQFNDVWPTVSWAVVDYYKVPKPGFYAIKRCLQPVVVGVVREVSDWTLRASDGEWKRDTGHVDLRQQWGDVRFDVWVSSFLMEGVRGRVVVRFFSVRSGREFGAVVERDVVVGENGTTNVLEGYEVEKTSTQSPDAPFETAKADPFVIHVSLFSLSNDNEITELIGTDTSWPEPIKYLFFPDRGVNVAYAEDWSSVVVTAERPVKGFVFAEVEGVRLSDNGFDVIPGEDKVVSITGVVGREMEWRYIGKVSV